MGRCRLAARARTGCTPCGTRPGRDTCWPATPARSPACCPRPAAVPDCSLNVPVGFDRRAVAVRQPLDALRRTEHHFGVTLNDLLLTAIASGVHDLLSARGEVTEGRRAAGARAGRVRPPRRPPAGQRGLGHGGAAPDRRRLGGRPPARGGPGRAVQQGPGSGGGHPSAPVLTGRAATGGGGGGQPPRAPPAVRQPGRDERARARRPALRARGPHARGHPSRAARRQPQRGRGGALLRGSACDRHPHRPPRLPGRRRARRRRRPLLPRARGLGAAAGARRP